MAQKNKKSTSKKPTLKDQLKTLNDDLESEKDKYLRLFAEFENFRKRTSKERIELFKTASKELMSALLPVLDDCLLYTSPSPRDLWISRMPSSA